MSIAPFVLVLCLAPGCGKKGAPLPRLQRIPSQVTDFAAARFADDVYVRFTLPTVNIDAAGPADVARVEVYAITLDTEETKRAREVPLEKYDPEKLRALSTLVFSERVQRAAPPIPEGAPAVPPLPTEPGVPPASTLVARDTLTPESRVPVALPPLDARRTTRERDVQQLPGPIVFEQEFGPRRYYFAVPISTRGRYGPHSSYAPVPLDPPSSAPTDVDLAYDETSLVIKWKPAPDARGVQLPASDGLLPSKPLVPGTPLTMYDVYEIRKEQLGADAPATMPQRMTEGPLNALEHKVSKPTLGVERCFSVRPIDVIAGIHVRGPATPVECIVLADTFPPAAPENLASVSAAGVINLIWDASDEPDLAGYLVLRGEAPGETLTPLTKEPFTGTSYADRSVQAGVTYVYAVVAVDKAGNRSKESNRREETSRQ